jgi:hypothetical protein
MDTTPSPHQDSARPWRSPRSRLPQRYIVSESSHKPPGAASRNDWEKDMHPARQPLRTFLSLASLVAVATTILGCMPATVVHTNQINGLVGVDDTQVLKIAESGRYEYNNAVLAAARAGDVALLKMLLASVVPPWRSIEPAYMAGSTLDLALFGAAQGNQRQIVDYAISLGVDRSHLYGQDQISTFGNLHGTAADVAHIAGHEELADYLVSIGVQRVVSDQDIRNANAEGERFLASQGLNGTSAAAGPTPADMANAYAAGANAAAMARGGQPILAPPYVSQATPVAAAPPTYVQNQNGSVANGDGGGQFDRGLVACITLGADSSGYYFQNSCGVAANILFACVDAGTGNIEAPGNVNPQPGQKSAAPCFLPRSKTLWVACPNNDGIFGADGHSIWQPGGPYTCKRVWGHGL